jgi:Ca-activated chloride channel family protein
MEFSFPFVFWLFGGLTLLGGALFLWQKKQRKLYALHIPFLEDLQKAQKKAFPFFSYESFLKYVQWGLFGGTVLLLAIALARPQVISKEKQVTKNGVDILIALDVSESMLAEDLQPNRMEAAKTYIDEFVQKLETDRIGLEVFAGKPFTQSPMSFDYNVIRYYLSEISTDTIDQNRRRLRGTAIGDAIVAAINRFQNVSERTKVLILLTDGEANVGVDPLFATEHARSKGIKIYTIGLGKKEGAPLKITNAFGEKTYARNPNGTLYKTKFDEEILKNIAHISGGRYFFAGNNDSLQKSFETINSLEKKEYEAETSVQKEDRFWKWLFWGFISGTLTFAVFLFRGIFFGVTPYTFHTKKDVL